MFLKFQLQIKIFFIESAMGCKMDAQIKDSEYVQAVKM